MAVMRWSKTGEEVSHCCHRRHIGEPMVSGHYEKVPVAWDKISDQALFDAGWFTDGRHWLCPQHAADIRAADPTLFDAAWRRRHRETRGTTRWLPAPLSPHDRRVGVVGTREPADADG